MTGIEYLLKMGEWIELYRSEDSADVETMAEFLQQGGIEVKGGTNKAGFDVGSVYGGGMTVEAATILSVERSAFWEARSILEAELAKSSLPSDHYLHESSEEDLIEMIAEASEWSAFDIAHAKRIALSRGIEFEEIQEKWKSVVEEKKVGKPAPRALVISGWVGCILGGIAGIGIAWSLMSMKERTPEGDFYAFDEDARAEGRKMLLTGGLIFALFVFARLAVWLLR